jgi:hypothetical protein
VVAHLRGQLFHANESDVGSQLIEPPVDLFTTIHRIRQTPVIVAAGRSFEAMTMRQAG